MPKTIDLETFKAQVREELQKEKAAGRAADPQGTTPDGGDLMDRLNAELTGFDLSGITDVTKVRETLLSAVQETLAAEYDRLQREQGQMLARMVAEATRDKNMHEFATALTSGAGEYHLALPVKPEDLIKFMKTLNQPQLAAFESLMKAIVSTGVVDFAELGSAGKGGIKRQLPDYIKAAGLTLAQLNDPLIQAELEAPLSEYDLSAYEGGK